MKKMRPQKQLLQLVMLSLLSVVSVLVTAGESAAMDCTSCHGTAGVSNRPNDSAGAGRVVATGAFEGNHSTHLGANPAVTDCAKCHNNSGYTNSHRNGQINMASNINTSPSPAAYSKGVFFNQTSVPTLGTCSTVNCHFETVTPQWSSSPAATTCDTCHSSVPTTNSHSAHTAQFGGTASCTKCHTDHTGTFQHATSAGKRVITVVAGSYTGGNLNYLPSQSGRTLGTCSTTYCHSTGQSLNGTSITPVYATTPTWGTPINDCTSCHDVAGTVTPAKASGTHAKHLARAGIDCGSCHTGASAATKTYASTNHVDGFINVSGSVNVQYSQGRSSAPGNGYGTCNNAACHAPFTDTKPLTSPLWGVTTTGCAYCHQSTPTTGAHTKHLALAPVQNIASGQSCDYCHTAVASVETATHINGSVDVIQMPTSPLAKHASGVYTATCTAACHTPYTNAGAGVTPNWGVSNANNCGLCHEVSPTTGVHARHLSSTLVTGCASCHTNAVANTSGGTGHLNGKIDVRQYPFSSVAKHSAGTYTATCTTTCHNPYSATATVATPTWGTTTVACSDCHTGAAALTATGPATGSHASHAVTDCSQCHTGATNNTTLPSANHVNGTINVANGYPATAKHAAGSYAGTCSTASCHNDPYTVGTTTKLVTPVWGTPAGCTACHSSASSAGPAGAFRAYTSNTNPGPATGSHNLHMNAKWGIYSSARVGCANCHSTPGSGATHNDGSVNVLPYGTNSPVAKHAPGSYLANGCSAVSCHQGVLSAPVPAATWGVTNGCATCHGFPPTTGGHPAVPDGNCNSCHSDVTAGPSTATTATFVIPSQHMDGKVEGGSCNACHGYPPVQADKLAGLINYSGAKLENYSGGGGVHTVAGHLSGFVRPGTAFGTLGTGGACLTCHPSSSHNQGNGVFYVANVQVQVDPKFKFNKDLPITYDRNGGPGSKTTGKCSNVSCHFQATPNWSTETFTAGH